MTHIVLWIHGTYDCPDSPDGKGKHHINYKSTESFKISESQNNKMLGARKDDGREAALKELVSDPNAEVWAFRWSGIGNEAARVQAGEFLGEQLNRYKDRKNEISVATHSHGGNVLGHALFRNQSLNIRAAYLFACPFFGSGIGSWRNNLGFKNQIGIRHSFSHPRDRIQAGGAAIWGGDINIDWKCENIFTNHSIDPWGGSGAHTSMSRSEAFIMAKNCIKDKIYL